MKKNIYYTELFGRAGSRKLSQLAIAFMILPKLILDVFLRKNMGERYFSVLLAVMMGLLLFYLPEWGDKVGMRSNAGNTLYYIFFAAYVIMAVVRYLEIRREPSVFDFAKFSLSKGIPFEFFYKIRIMGKRPTTRTVEIFYEPLFCCLIGIALGLLGNGLLACVIVVCSISYFLHNQVSAILGDHFVMDKIDEIICNQDMSETFVQDKEASDRQVPFFSRKPSTEALRQKFVDDLQNSNKDDDDESAAFAA